MIDRGSHNVLGVRISAVDFDAAVARILAAAKASQPMAVSALAVHGLMTGVLDSVHRHRLNTFDLLVPDGQPVRWGLNWLHGVGLKHRVDGPSLMLKTVEQAAERKVPIFLFGGTEQLLDELSEQLLKLAPTLTIAGRRASKFRRLDPAERAALVEEIRASGAQITFVGLGCPRQEVWAFELREALSMPILAVGAAFNFHAGHLARAPEFMQKNGLEWLFRLVAEPRRLWRRYLFLNPLYLSLLAMQWTGLRRFDPHATAPPMQDLSYG
jgi:N-acetylglucosaminyldiphosphoundecaprenol N-acetyl-beta-D-mannosaminyltransferase